MNYFCFEDLGVFGIENLIDTHRQKEFVFS